MNQHSELLDALASNLDDDNAFLVYADLIQERRDEEQAAQIRTVVAATSEAIRGTDDDARERARERRRHLIQTGRFRSDAEVRDCRAEAESERTRAVFARPSSSGMPRPPRNPT